MSRQEVYADTKKRKYPVSETIKYKLKTIPDISKKQKKIRSAVSVVYNDSLSVAQKIVQGYGDSVCILNFANNGAPGGGYQMQGRTQEEDLFRRTNIWQTIKPSHYPIGDRRILWTPKVTVFRASERHGDKILDKPFKVSIISCVAICGPRFKYLDVSGDKTDYNRKEDRNLTQDKTDMIMKCAAQSGCDAVLLGAWGCGVFGNPEYGLIQCWKKSIRKYPVPEVIFPIYEEGTPADECFQYKLFKKYC